MSALTENQRKKARQTVQARGISGPPATNVKASTTLIADGGDSSYTRHVNYPTPQPPGIPGTPHNDRGQSSTPGPSTIHGHPNLAPQNPSRPPSAHSRASSGDAPPNDTASTSQRGSSDSSRSRSSAVSSRDPFEYDSPEYKERLEKK
ncbi:uncharacterized protein EAF02_003630 [Botrytis sinoallii]|uniref:uncharacterized protein n=1 Tax=Botrytis sinoallii TaxID=1463999 RepID=UPI00190257AA|nr:uncharacterized protein EAF02_003630 [Botrytis sinoallii]KAF7886983.1 hypothetical protein EAF02_003630 [Botrytis sinoallii]